MQIRKMTIQDYEKVYELWMSCKNMGFNDIDDSKEGIARFLERNPSTSFVALENENLVIYEAILVDPSYRGANLMKRMLEHIEAKELENQRTTALIQIAIDNPASWINALHHGMHITKVDLDPEDGAKVLYLEKKLVPTTPKATHLQDNIKTYNMYLGDDIHKKIPPLFIKMQHLISKGYSGVNLNKETKSLIWQKNERVKTKFTLYDIMNYKKYQKTGTL